jgi:hypothetical protein
MAMLIVVVFEYHDYILEQLARHAVRHARAVAARHRLALEARRAQEDTLPATDPRDPPDIPRLPAPERITGFVALAIKPDAATIRTSQDLAVSLLPAAAEPVIGPGSWPHVTLMQCAVREAPRARVREFIARLEEVLRGQSIPLSAIVSGRGSCSGAPIPTARDGGHCRPPTSMP